MRVNRRTLTLLIVAVVVIGGVYAVTLWQRSQETRRLVADLQSPDHAVAASAMMTLRDRVPAISDELVEFLGSAQGPVRWRSAVLLGEAGDRVSRDALIAALRDEHATVRAQAALSLAKRQIPAAADTIALIASADEEPIELRIAALRALRSLRTGTHFGEVAGLLKDRPATPKPAEGEEGAEEWTDETAALRAEAARTAAVLGAAARGADEEQQPAVEAAAALAEAATPIEPDDDVRQAAAYALADLAILSPLPDVRARVTEALLIAADDEIGDVRVAAIYGLRLVEHPREMADRVAATIQEAASDDHYWVRQAAQEAI
jgi:HEAT repeat protein